MEFFNNTQVFHPMYSMLYTVNLGLCDYVPFSQIRSHMQVFHPMYSILYTVNLGLCDYVPFFADPVTFYSSSIVLFPAYSLYKPQGYPCIFIHVCRDTHLFKLKRYVFPSLRGLLRCFSVVKYMIMKKPI